MDVPLYANKKRTIFVLEQELILVLLIVGMDFESKMKLVMMRIRSRMMDVIKVVRLRKVMIVQACLQSVDQHVAIESS